MLINGVFAHPVHFIPRSGKTNNKYLQKKQCFLSAAYAARRT
jgi:hypothetical protein